MLKEVEREIVSDATRATVEDLTRRLLRLPFEPYQPVLWQLRSILLAVNRAWDLAGLERVPEGAKEEQEIAFRFQVNLVDGHQGISKNANPWKPVFRR